MDLRTIINNDSSAQPQKPPPSPRRTSGPEQDYFQSAGPHSRNNGSPVFPRPQDQRVRPPQPPPLQPPHQGGSISYGSAQSPYQSASASTSTLSGGGLHSQGSQPAPPTLHASQSHPGYGPPQQQQQQGPVLSSPFTPHPISAGTAQSYFTQSHSAIHSATTPTSARSYSYPRPPQIRRDSTSTSQQAIPLPQSYSPSQQQSQPGTPMARPLNSFPQTSPHSGRPISSGRDGQMGALGSPWANQDPQRLDQRPAAISPVAQPPLSRHNSYPQPAFIPEQLRDPTLSVSPKAASISLRNPQHDISRSGSLAGPPIQHNRSSSGETKLQANNGPTTFTYSHPHDASSPSQTLPPPTTPKASSSEISPRNSTVSPPRSKQPSLKDMSPPPPIPHPESISAPPRKKRKRYAEPPIFAQLAPRTSGTPPAIPNRPHVAPPSLPAKPPPRTTDRVDAASRSTTPRRPPPPPPPPARPAPNGQLANGNPPALERKDSTLGPWEPSIAGVIPHEEITKAVCDFLFENVVMRKDIGAAPAGAAAAGAGAVLEIEAKLGQLVDRNRGTRVQLPVLTETVLNKDDPGLRIAFESSMSLAQHRALNNFLNEAVTATVVPGTTRVPISYAHKKERDSFYEISPKALPHVVQNYLNPRHKPKVRVTTDQQTGAVLARIIKCRIADMDVYSPRTCLDWRISVNLEMHYDGDLGELISTERDDIGGPGQRRGGGARGDRNKDRMSYRHLAYQVDLTQVASSDAPQDFDHELEVEISSAEVRRQGDLAMTGDPKNQYEEVIKGFVDNVRVLARAVPQY